MSKTTYYLQNALLSEKRNQVKIIFRRIATQDQLDALARQKADNKKQRDGLHSLTFMSMFSTNDEPTLNFDAIQFVLPIKDVQRLDLKIGMIVELNIPEDPEDIKIVQEGPHL